jgi:hypothetical protein
LRRRRFLRQQNINATHLLRALEFDARYAFAFHLAQFAPDDIDNAARCSGAKLVSIAQNPALR